MGLVVLPDGGLISLLVELRYIVVYINHVDPDCRIVKDVVAGGCCYDNEPMTSGQLVVKQVGIGHRYHT